MQRKTIFNIPDLNTLPNPYKGIERVNAPITDIEAFKSLVENRTVNHTPYSKKYFCVMLFYQQANITGNYSDSNQQNTWINTSNHYFHNGALALNFYTNSPCPTTQLIDANSIEELISKRNNIIEKFNHNDIHDLIQ